jgi:hypothetical protein
VHLKSYLLHIENILSLGRHCKIQTSNRHTQLQLYLADCCSFWYGFELGGTISGRKLRVVKGPRGCSSLPVSRRSGQKKTGNSSKFEKGTPRLLLTVTPRANRRRFSATVARARGTSPPQPRGEDLCIPMCCLYVSAAPRPAHGRVQLRTARRIHSKTSARIFCPKD